MVTVNSVIVSGCITAATLFFCTLAGYAFAKMGFRSRGGPMTAVIATLTIPPQLSVVPLFMMMSDIGWGGKLESVIFPTLVSAFGVFFMRQYLTEALPYELIEAAKVDGANNFRIVRSVVLPVARPAMMVLGMLTFVQAWNDFFWPYLALNQQNPTLQVALGRLSASYTPDQSIVMAGALISTLPLLVVFVIFGKQIVGVIMSGAVKRWQRHVVAVAVVVVVPATAQTSVTLNLQRPRAPAAGPVSDRTRRGRSAAGSPSTPTTRSRTCWSSSACRP